MMNRLYVVEPTPIVTGAYADHRLPLRASEVELFARALAVKLGLGGSVTLPPGALKWLGAGGKDLQKHQGAWLVVAGEAPPAGPPRLALPPHAPAAPPRPPVASLSLWRGPP